MDSISTPSESEENTADDMLTLDQFREATKRYEEKMLPFIEIWTPTKTYYPPPIDDMLWALKSWKGVTR